MLGKFKDAIKDLKTVSVGAAAGLWRATAAEAHRAPQQLVLLWQHVAVQWVRMQHCHTITAGHRAASRSLGSQRCISRQMVMAAVSSSSCCAGHRARSTGQFKNSL
jgi:hypothetical protein